MRLFLRILVVIAAVLAGSMALAARTPGSKVGVTFDHTTVEFGNVRASDGNVHLEYTMTNESDKAVAILSARAACGCTDPTYPRRPVMPGESAVIKVTFNTAGQRGEVDKEVTLRLKRADGKSEKVQLILRGAVVPD